jgi:hypothetical protein
LGVHHNGERIDGNLDFDDIIGRYVVLGAGILLLVLDGTRGVGDLDLLAAELLEAAARATLLNSSATAWEMGKTVDEPSTRTSPESLE